jgi:hypothetical protein
MYSFADVSGIQKIGTYQGNGTSKTIYTTDDGTSSGSNGFQPSFILIKVYDDIQHWYLFDSARGASQYLRLDTNGQDAPASSALTSFNTDGFSIGNSGAINTSSKNYIYLAIK